MHFYITIELKVLLYIYLLRSKIKGEREGIINPTAQIRNQGTRR